MSDDHRDFKARGDKDSRYMYHDPVERFGQLPEPTRQWLERLREEDIKELNDAVRFYHATKAGGRFVKWLMITIVAIFVGAAAFGEALQKLWTLISHAIRS
jgi:hypothetical protein